MTQAIIIVDMIRDNVYTGAHGMGDEARRIVPKLQELVRFGRQHGMKIVFACDSFMPDDFFFQGKMQPHALRGTDGVKVIEELAPAPGDIVLEKRRFSAFMQTDLDITLREAGVREVAVGGISTQACVLVTAMDAICLDYRVTWLEDCCTSYPYSLHEQTIEVYRKFPLYPLLQIKTLEQFAEDSMLHRE
ncbi:MAG: cysteine hydrolase [Clostridia bacterium]|nr:MAG: cysteine hydrolase [Clostridia bacterium]